MTARNALLLKSPILFAAALFFGAASPLGGAMAQEQGAPALTVSVEAPARRDWPETVPASGWLKPWQEAVIASETSGLRITEILVDVGSVVKKGQPLVRLFQETVLAELRQQEAAVATAKANFEKARTEAGRARQLSRTKALSEQAVDERLTEEQTAAANLASAEAALDLQKIKLEQTTITAVDDGLITSNSALLGAVVSPGTELFRIIRQQRIEWQAEVSARYLPRMREGLRVAINGPGNQPIEGKVRLVAPLVSTGTGRAVVYVALPDGTDPRVGLYVTGNVELETTPALTVPETAISFRDGLSYVFVTDDNSRARRVRVETGRRNGGEVEILSGLEATSRVVTSGGAFLSDNVLVDIVGDDQ